jgi:hypothetical protein
LKISSQLHSELQNQRTILGLRSIPFYITAKKNPHVKLESFSVQVDDLAKNPELEFTYTSRLDPKQVSIYTRAVFRSYRIKQ